MRNEQLGGLRLSLFFFFVVAVPCLTAAVMDSHPRILRIPGTSTALAGDKGDTKQTPVAVDDYVIRETAFLPPTVAATPDNQTALTSKLNAIASRYAHFYRSVAPCVLASCRDLASRSRAAALDRVAAPSRSSSQGVKSANGTERIKGKPLSQSAAAAVSAASGAAGCAPPDIDLFWSATSPLPPTAVLTALYSFLPLRHASVVRDDTKNHSGSADVGAESTDDEAAARAQPSPASLELFWTLCRSAEPAEKDERSFSFWEAFAMTAMAVHIEVEKVTGAESAELFQRASSSSALSFSLAQQLRRGSAVLESFRQSSAAAAAAANNAPLPSAAATLLEWPEELLWSLLVSLLAVLALVHGAGLHFSGQLTAADVLCLSCDSSLPRLLEQTWQDVLTTANGSQNNEERARDSIVLFRRFYSMASQSVLLPQASLTTGTPCHSAFFVVQPSLELLSSRRPAREQPTSETLAAGKGVSNVDFCPAAVATTAPASSAAQEVADETPEQQARFHAADLASVGRVLTAILELRAQWAMEGGARFATTTVVEAAASSAAAPATASPSSELMFLVRRLCECDAVAQSMSAPQQRGCPTALQLLQLHALRLRTETWYYHRLAAEAYDRLAQARLAQRALAVEHNSDVKEEELRAREAAVAEREAKLDLVLRIYELTHEHLDAVKLPRSQTPDSNKDESADPIEPPYVTEDGDDHRSSTRSQTLRDDSLEALLAAPAHRQATTTTSPSEGAAAPLAGVCKAPPTNTSHKQHGAVVPRATADISADVPLELSPLPCSSGVADADTTLLSVSEAPFSSHRAPEESDLAHVSAAFAEGRMESGSVRALPWAAQEVAAVAAVQTGAAAGVGGGGGGGGNFTPHEAAPLTALPHFPLSSYTPSNPTKVRPAQQPASQLVFFQQRSEPRDEDNSTTVLAVVPRPMTVVEVELDDSSDMDEAANVSRVPAVPSDATRQWAVVTRRAASQHDERLVSNAAPLHDLTFASSPHPQQSLFVSSPSAVAAVQSARIVQDLKTPVRPPALPNMGTADVNVSGISAATVTGGGDSHSKYSSLALLRSPPSARRPTTGSRRTETSSSPSVHSPESYRSSTKPYTPVAPAQHLDGRHAARQDPPTQRSSRRRSASRGSGSGDRPAAAAGAAPGSENGEWARQQLTELQNMQLALRAQQPATPRSRASAAAAAVGGDGGLDTPELRRARSPASLSSSSPALRAAQEAAATPPSPPVPMTTPTRHSTRADRSPENADSSHRVSPRSPYQQQAQHMNLHHHDSHTSYHHREALQTDERPAQVLGTSAWPAASAMRTPLSSRQRRAHAVAPASTVAALEAALRTPPRQTVPATAAATASEHRRLAQLLSSSRAPLPSSPPGSAHGSAKKSDGVSWPAAQAAVLGRRRPASAEGSATAPARNASRCANAKTATFTVTPLSEKGGTEVSLRRTNGGGVVGGGHVSGPASGAPQQQQQQQRGGASATSTMELLRRLRAGSAATA